MPARVSFQQIAGGLSVQERVLLFCLSSNTDWQRAGVTHATAQHMRGASCWSSARAVSLSGISAFALPLPLRQDQLWT